MQSNKSPLERAFELARSGEYPTLSALVQKLSREGYSANQIEGPQLKKQLNAIIHAAQAGKQQATSEPAESP